jgi:branched-chain amino acid transport system ATP-binding protein
VTAAEPVLELRAITAGYGRSTVLRDVDLVVPAGTVVALLGPNGAGKTTLLRTASGLLRPSSGTVRVGGLDVTRRSPHRRTRAGLCLIPEGRGVFPTLSVRENLMLEIPPWRRPARFDAALEAFPILATRLGQRAGTLSGGEQRMLSVARCYLAGPSVVLLDEISTGLAPRVVEQIFESLVGLTRGGVSLLLVEQYVQRALDWAETVYLLSRGRVVFSGRASELDEAAVVSGYLGTAPPPRKEE